MALRVWQPAQLSSTTSYGIDLPYVLRSGALKADKTTDLETLMARVKDQQCRESYHLIFNCMYPKVLSYLKQSGLAPELASEKAQEVLLSVWNKAALFDPAKGTLESWIFAITRNIKFDFFRGSKHEALRVSAEDIFETLETHTSSPDRNVENSEVHRQLAALPRDQKEVVEAMYFDGLSQSEYSEIKGIPLGTVKSRIRLALAQLKKAMERK